MNAPSAAPRLPRWRAAGWIVAGGVVAYANSLGVPFLFDDIPAIVENPGVRSLGTALGFGGAEAGGLTLSGRPVVALSLALNHALGRDAVAGYHAVNLLVHVAAGLALFGVLRRVWATLPRLARSADALALGVAFCWTVHPLQTESVTYIVQRAEALMALAFLLTLYAFARATEAGRAGDAAGERRWLAWSVAVCAAGMGTKEVMVTAPVVVWLFDRTFFARSFAGAWQARPRYYAALAATWLLLGYFIASTGGNRGGTVGFGVGITPWAYAATQFEAVARYLGLALWPSPLVFEYGTFWVEHAAGLLPFALLVVPLLVLTIVALRRWPAAGFAGACLFGILAPSSLTPGTIQMIVEHRMYLPLAAVLALAGAGMTLALGARARPLLIAIGVLGVALTLARNRAYQDERTLWSLTVAQRPHNAIALRNAGLAEFRAGRVDAAIALYERALRVNPASVEAQHNLGVAHARQGRWPDAIHHYAEAARLSPRFAEPQFHLGNALLEAGRAGEAAAALATAVRLQPNWAEAHFSLGNALAELGRMPEAATHFTTVVRLNPRHANARVNLGNVCAQLERWAEAQSHYEAALRIDPGLPDAHNNLGLVLRQAGRLREAITHFEQALAARPGFATAERNLAETRAAVRAGAK